MGEKPNNRPSAEKILSLLVELLADQHGARVKYQIIKKEDDQRAPASMAGGVAV